MKRFNFLVLVLMMVGLTATSFKSVEEEGQSEEAVKWYSFEEAVALNKKKPKKIFIDVYTDWCGWCKKMDKATFNHPKIAEYLNDKYYPVKLNAEQRENIEFDGHTFKWVAGGRNGVHELAYSLLQGKMSYPTVVFMDEEFKMLSPVPGYLEVGIFEQIITYYGDNNYKETPWKEYQASFESSL